MPIAGESQIALQDPPQNLQELFDHQVGFAALIFREQQAIHPMWVGQDADGILYPMTAAFGSEQEKREVIAGIKETFHKLGVIRYVAMYEAWIVASDDPIKVRPTEHPDRKEIVFITGEEHGEKSLMCHMDIIRSGENDATLGEPVIHNDLEKFHDIFTDVLPKPSSAHGNTLH